MASSGIIKLVFNIQLTKHSISQQIKEKLFKISIGKFVRKQPQIGKLGQFTSTSVGNVDQTPLSFTFTNKPMYESKGAKTVWIQGGSSGLDKCQCTVQLTLFADGVLQVKPLVIFRVTSKHITLRERLKYDQQVGVTIEFHKEFHL